MIEILTGFISGIVSGTGMGGGTILILCLSIFLGINQKIAQATNLIFFIPTSIAAIYVNIKKKKIDFKVAKIIILFGIIGAILGAVIAKSMDTRLLRKLFGICKYSALILYKNALKHIFSIFCLRAFWLFQS